MTDIIYEYSARDSLESPQSYSYSEFRGVDFLKSYKNARLKIIKYLKAKEPNQLEKITPSQNFFQSIKEQSVLNTWEILQSLHALLVETPEPSPDVSDWLNKYLKRYEITKKIYSEYTPEMKPSVDDYKNLKNYSLLSLNLLLYYQKTGNLKFLNTALKLNDMLCSNKEKLDNKAAFLCIAALELEQGAVKQLVARKEVVL